jgi:hypothetical protein
MCDSGGMKVPPLSFGLYRLSMIFSENRCTLLRIML